MSKMVALSATDSIKSSFVAKQSILDKNNHMKEFTDIQIYKKK